MAERGPSMRLDLYLWYARLARTRSAAQALATTQRMRLDGRLVERAATPVRVGAVLTFAQGAIVRALHVDALPRRRGPAPEARTCYTELTIGSAAATPGGENPSQQAALD